MATEYLSLRQAAIATGIDRNTLSRWVKLGLLPSKKGKARHLETTLVNVARAKELAKGRKPGRPKKQG